MGQRPSEELELVATRIPAIVARKLQTMADAEGRATSSLARVIIENFFYVGLRPQRRATSFVAFLIDIDLDSILCFPPRREHGGVTDGGLARQGLEHASEHL